jgi:hypothetical protein
VPARARTRASAVGGEYPIKELADYSGPLEYKQLVGPWYTVHVDNRSKVSLASPMRSYQSR